MRGLLDVNILVALLDREHAAHEAACASPAQNLHEVWASCPITENGLIGFLRFTFPFGESQHSESILLT